MTDGQPAIGWISRVFREGQKLYADFVDMPRSVFEAVKNKLYRTVSIELLFDVDHKGKRFGHVLDAVALLGADHPAVNTLADLDALLATRTSFSGGQRLCFETIAGKHVKRLAKEDNEMDEKVVKQMIAEAISEAVKPHIAQVEALTKERDDFKRKAEDAEKEQADFKADQRKQKIVAARKIVTDTLDTAVRDKRMTPAMRETYAAQIGVDSDDRVLEIDVEQVKLMCSVKADDSEDGKHRSRSKEVDDAGQELTNLTRVFMAEHNEKNFARALDSVARANPDLHKQYLDSNSEG
jgi:uncharacterized membrane protein